MQLILKTPSHFNFRRTVLSHGWCVLLPFEFDRTNWILTRVLNLDRGKPVTITMSPRKGGMTLQVSRRVSETAAQRILRDVRHMFRLDDDLQSFYDQVSADPEF